LHLQLIRNIAVAQLKGKRYRFLEKNISTDSKISLLLLLPQHPGLASLRASMNTSEKGLCFFVYKNSEHNTEGSYSEQLIQKVHVLSFSISIPYLAVTV